MKKLSIDSINLLILGIVTFFVLVFTWGHHGGLIIDCGREAYYPLRVLQGKVLYKDIFNIYGPFAYLFNAFLYKIFGVSLNVLYVAGAMCSFLFVSLTYFISRKVLNPQISFAIGLFMCSVGVLSGSIFNFIFPYSYGMLYGTIAFMASLLFLVNFLENPNQSKFLILSFFFAGISFVSKYEFIPYIIVLLFFAIKMKKESLKNLFLGLSAMLLMPVLCIGILFLQGLRLPDILEMLSLIHKMTGLYTLKYFYENCGVFLQKQTIPNLIKVFLINLIPAVMIFLSFKVKKKYLAPILSVPAIFIILTQLKQDSFVYLPILVAVLVIAFWKNIKTNKALLTITFASMIVSLKFFWSLVVINYGSFTIGLLLTVLFAILVTKYDNEVLKKSIFVYMIASAISFVFVLLPFLIDSKVKLQTQRGTFYYIPEYASPTQKLIDYINSNTEKTDKIVILPEGALINFLTNRESDDFYTSIIPLYAELFTSDKLIEHFKKTQPEYFIFNNWDTGDYYFRHICQDYAVKFCEYVDATYSYQGAIGEKFKYLIYKKK